MSEEKPKHQDISRFVAVGSLLLQGFSALQYILIQNSIEKGALFFWQFFIFLGLSMGISLSMRFYRRIIPVFLSIRLFLLFLIGYPLGTELWLELTLLLSILLEAGLYLDPPWNLLAMVLADTGLLMFQKPVNAFYTDLPAPGMQDLLFCLVLSLLVTLLLSFISRLNRDLKDHQINIDRLDEALSRLGKANLGFQNMTTNLELETLKKERNRVSREIHDTVGYSLTNIRIMLDAAALMIDSDKERTQELIRNSMDEAGTCLEETRNAMRQLRSKDVSKVQGMKSFFHLANVFGDATGIRVKIEFGNVPDSFGDRIDKAVFRFIQEGLTNSFRHGRASKISIYFWMQNAVLTVSLRDNGTGAGGLTEGIGLAGMKERLSELDGKMVYQNVSDGFEIAIKIPLYRREEV